MLQAVGIHHETVMNEVTGVAEVARQQGVEPLLARLGTSQGRPATRTRPEVIAHALILAD